MRWPGLDGKSNQVTAPLSLIITAFAPVNNVEKTWTPALRSDAGETVLVFIDLARGKQRLGGSALAQVFKQLGSEAPDVEEASDIKAFFTAVQSLKSTDVVLAYHDRSDGGLFTTLSEMAFAGRQGLEISLDAISSNGDCIASLFNEELGAVVQVRNKDLLALTDAFVKAGFPTRHIHVIGKALGREDQSITLIHESRAIYTSTRGTLQQLWAETSYKMQARRDEPLGAKEEYDAIVDEKDEGLLYDVKFPFLPLGQSYDPLFQGRADVSAIVERLSTPPKVCILREQGVNGQIEMAWAFHAAGFEAIDVHMSDIITGRITLSQFAGLAACGGFSYGDVLGAGNGWAKSVLLNHKAREEFQAFFKREDTFALGVCNGCQFFSQLKEIIPGAEAWPAFKANRSERFEGRVASVTIDKQAAESMFLKGMEGSSFPVAVAHGEGRASFAAGGSSEEMRSQGLIPVRYVDSKGEIATKYPANPNGSPEGIAAVQTSNGRVLAIMPHPERVVAAESNSWVPEGKKAEWGGKGPWFRLFQNAYEFAISKK
jgi:phosphoribosylformylglycinamidine synthase